MKSRPLDVLLLLALAPAYVRRDNASVLIVVALALYVGVALWQPLDKVERLPEQFNRIRLAFLLRWFLALIVITAAVALPTIANIASLLTSERDADGFNPAYVTYNDGALQIALAMEKLQEGVNPYAATYDDSPLRYHSFVVDGQLIGRHPANEYFVYLPGFLWLSWPFYQFFAWMGLPYDQRWIFLFAYLILILILPRITKAPSDKLTLLIAVGLNPLLASPIVIGQNDVVIILTVIASLLAWEKGKEFQSAVWFGIACSLKQFAWLMAPFYLLMVITRPRNGASPTFDWKRGVQTAVIVSAIFAVLAAPFFWWDPAAFWEDIFLYPSGQVALNYPITGYSIGMLVLGLGWVSSPFDYFPFWIFQALIGFPILFFMLKKQWQQRTVGAMLLGGGIFIFGFGLASRFFQDNYVGLVMVLLTLGWLWPDRQEIDG